jgi:hypothetical protein
MIKMLQLQSLKKFTSSGTLETVQENIISVRNARIENKQVFEEQAVARTTGSQLVNSRVIAQTQEGELLDGMTH